LTNRAEGVVLNMFSAKRLLLAGATALAVVGIPITAAVVTGVGTGVASSSPPPPPDVIQYVQSTTATTATKATTTETSRTYSYSYVYTPGNGSGAATQTLTPSGRCGTPTVSGTSSGGTVSSASPAGAGFLSLGGKLYPANDYSGTPVAATVGASRAHTGVCAIGGPQTIDNRTSTYSTRVGAEALDFGVGSSSTIGSNRLFSSAQVTLEREGGYGGTSGDDDDFRTGTGTPAPVSVRMIESYAGSLVASQTCTFTGADETDIVGDTNLNSTCTGTAATVPFDTLEVQDLTVNSAVSVVGTSTFTLANQVCGGGSVTATGSVAATLSVPSTATGCESYSTFSSLTDPTTGQTSLIFNAHSSTPQTSFTVNVPWNPQPACQPGQPTSDTTVNPLPTCAPTLVSLDGVTYSDQTYCSHPTTANPLCTQNKVYNYIQDPTTNAEETQISETWVGFQDWSMRH